MKAAEFKKLGDYVKIKTGKLDANASSDDGEYPFFTCSIEPLKISSFSYDCECCLVAGNGDLNVKYYNGKFDAYQRTYIIESLDKEKLDVMYLYFFLCSYIEVLRKQSIGGVIKYIKLGNLTDALIPIPSLEKQKKICRNLIKAQKVLNENQALFSKYDTLIKSRFIEMFGDLDCNIKTIEQTCTMKSGTTFSKDEENDSGEIFYIKVSGMNLPENDKYIKTSLSFVSRKVAGKTIIPANSIIFPKRGGAIGTNKKRITEQEICIDLNTMAVTPSNELNIQYLYQYFQNLDMGKLYNGSTVPQINNKDIGPLKIKVPPLELQQQFATFVQQIDKSKFAVQKALEKAETLYKSLMQRYFA